MLSKKNGFDNSLGLNHPSVAQVLAIAEEILNENRILDTNLLYERAKKKLNIPRKGLLTIIQYLVDTKVLVEGSKFTRETVLENPHRKRILGFITMNIGANFSFIRDSVLSDAESVSGSSGQLVWHLEMLLKFHYIKRIKFKNNTIFLPVGMEDEVGIMYYILRDGINQKIMTSFLTEECIKKSNIYKLINENREKVYYRLTILEERGMIVNSDDNKKELCLNKVTKKKLQKALNEISRVMT